MAPLLARIEQVAKSGDTAAYLALLTSGANRERAVDFCSSELLPGATRAVVKERDREPLRGTLAGNGYRLMVDVLTEFGPRARVATWRLDVKRVGERRQRPGWAIDDEERLSAVENLYRLALNPAKAVRGPRSEDRRRRSRPHAHRRLGVRRRHRPGRRPPPCCSAAAR